MDRIVTARDRPDSQRLVLGFVAAGTATLIAAFVIRQVLLVETLKTCQAFNGQSPSRLPVVRGTLSVRKLGVSS
jgi:hypothetical protein